MGTHTRAAESKSDRQFLLWVLAGLIAASTSSAIVAMALAVTMPGFP